MQQSRSERLFAKSSPFVKRPWLARVVPTCCFVVVWNFVWILKKETFSAPLSFSHCLYGCVRVCVYAWCEWWRACASSYVNAQFSAPLSPLVSGKPVVAQFLNMIAVFLRCLSLSFFLLCVFKWMGSKNPNIRSSLPHLPLSFYQLHLSLSPFLCYVSLAYPHCMCDVRMCRFSYTFYKWIPTCLQSVSEFTCTPTLLLCMQSSLIIETVVWKALLGHYLTLIADFDDFKLPMHVDPILWFITSFWFCEAVLRHSSVLN